jgi:biotin carboxyl carrier protein
MLKIKIDKDKIFDFNIEKGTIKLNGKDFQVDISQLAERRFHLIKDNRCFVAEVIQYDKGTKTFKIKVNGKLIELQVRDQLDLLIEKMGMSEVEGLKINDVKAPMPGLILDIKVKVGQEVELGENILILEAMKMENVIKSPRKGVIKEIKVKQGQSVEKNQILLTF